MFCEIKIATDALDEAIRIVAGSVIAPAVGAVGHEYRDQTHYVLTVRRLGSTLSAYTCRRSAHPCCRSWTSSRCWIPGWSAMANGSASPKGSCSCRKRSKTGDAARRYRSFWACLRAYLSHVRLAEGNEYGGRCGVSPHVLHQHASDAR